MTVTKCDRCGAYIDKEPLKAPFITYGLEFGGSQVDHKRLNICGNCLGGLIDWLKEGKDDNTGNA